MLSYQHRFRRIACASLTTCSGVARNREVLRTLAPAASEKVRMLGPGHAAVTGDATAEAPIALTECANVRLVRA